MTKKAKSKATKLVVPQNRRAGLRKLIKAECSGVANAKTAACLSIARELADMFKDVPEADYRKAKVAAAQFLRTDKGTLSAAEPFGTTWRQYANLTAFAMVAMIKFPGREFTSLRSTVKGAGTGSKAAATVGQVLVNGDGKKDARGDNAKAKKTRTPKAPGEPKLRKEGADVHPDAEGCTMINARRMGDAMIDHARELGALAALLADDVPDTDALLKVARKLSKTGGRALAEWDALREHGGTRYELQTGNDTPVRSLI